MHFLPPYILSPTERKRGKLIFLTLSVVILCALTLLFFFPASEYHFYPQCPTYSLTKTYCPGCGTTRAIDGVLHGNIKALFTYNIFALFALPYLLYNFLLLGIGAFTGKRPPLLSFNGKEMLCITTAIILYWILRNSIPALAPHG